MTAQRARRAAVVAAGGALYAFFFAFGSDMEAQGTCPMPGTLFKALALTPLFCLLLLCAFRLTLRRPPRPDADGRTFRAPLAFLFILGCYLPMFAVLFPGSFVIDTDVQLAQIVLGSYSTHHPLLHTLLLKACIDMTPLLGSLNRAAALYTALQIALMAACFSQVCASIARAFGRRSARLAAAFFALYPLHMSFACSATKDVLFSAFFALQLALLVELVKTRALPGRRFALLVLSGALATLLRNNMVYALAAWLALAAPLLARRGGGRALLAAACSLLLALAGNAALKAATHAQDGDMREALSFPIQQLARVRLNEADTLTDEQREVVDTLIVREKWREYDPRISDPVKGVFDTGALLADPARCLRAYLDIGRAHPQAYLDAVIALCYPFFYPYREYRGRFDYVEISDDMAAFDRCYGEGRVRMSERFAPVREWLEAHLWKDGADRTPLVRELFNAGAVAWAMLFFALRQAYEGRRLRFGVSLLPLLLWGTYLLGPVMYARYVYPFICALPILASRERS